MNGQTYRIGLDGEETARKYLEEQGMIFVRSRYRCVCGEIDLVMLDGDTLVFTEGKTRSYGPEGSGLMAVDRRKQERLSRAALIFMKEFHRTGSHARFDVVEINNRGIIHIRDAFHPGLPL